ncbi:MAG: hypothetical protein WCS99_19685 [Limisphaerales bacterium]
MGLKNSALNAPEGRASSRRRQTIPTGLPDKKKGSPKAEEIRHGKRLQEQQFTILKQAASLVYRTRNGARTLNEAMHARSASVSRSEIQQLREQHSEIKELLFEEIAILPPAIFRILHSQGHALHSYCVAVERILHQRGKRQAAMNNLDSLEEGYLLLDEGYHQLTEAIRAELGVSGG